MTELNFKGKEFVYNHHLAVPFRPLVPHPKKGIGPVALDGNLVIHGDNLHALKALLPLYAVAAVTARRPVRNLLGLVRLRR
jgi:adenine-specific DNA-methyltransferase